MLLRLAGKWRGVPVVGHNLDKYLRLEVVCALLNMFLFFLLVIAWGATCFEKVSRSSAFTNVTATGFAYLCVDLFFTVGVVVLMFFIRRSELGNRGKEIPKVADTPPSFPSVVDDHDDPAANL